MPDDFGRAREIIRAIGTEYLGEKLHTWDEVFESPDGVLWTAEMAGRVAGFACSGRVDRGVVLFHTDIVDPQLQRSGIGTALTLLRLATLDAEAVKMIVLQSTGHSMPFYQRFGFRAAEERHQDAVSKVWLRWMLLDFSEELARSAWRALDAAGVGTPFGRGDRW